MGSFWKHLKSLFGALMLLLLGVAVLVVIALGSTAIFFIAIGAVVVFIGYCIHEAEKETDENN